jgi:sec-independent protein translocase protein TatA
MPEPLRAIAFGFWEVLLVAGVLMLLFGARKLPMLARGLGQSIRNFKGELQAPPGEDEDDPS